MRDTIEGSLGLVVGRNRWIEPSGVTTNFSKFQRMFPAMPLSSFALTTDLAEVHVVGLIGGPTGFRAWIVPRDEELEQLIVSAASLFMTAVRDGIQPALDGSPQVRAWLAERYPPRPEPVVWVCDDNAVIQAGVEFCDARAARARADGDMSRLGNVLIQAAGQHGADTVECEHWRATWRADKRGRTVLRVRDLRGLDVAGGEEWEP